MREGSKVCAEASGVDANCERYLPLECGFFCECGHGYVHWQWHAAPAEAVAELLY
jgi:hypothetical protein